MLILVFPRMAEHPRTASERDALVLPRVDAADFGGCRYHNSDAHFGQEIGTNAASSVRSFSVHSECRSAIQGEYRFLTSAPNTN